MTAADLFVEGRFQASSGGFLDEKFECDALTDNEINCLANMIVRRWDPLFKVKQVVWVPPRNGIYKDEYAPRRLALRIHQLIYQTIGGQGQTWVIDDVYTTGRSLQTEMDKHGKFGKVVGWVIFDRSKQALPMDVSALFTLDATSKEKPNG